MKPTPLLVLLRYRNEGVLKNQSVISVASPSRSGRVLDTKSLIDSMKVDFRQHCCFNVGHPERPKSHSTQCLPSRKAACIGELSTQGGYR
jgi:hypothetical protein